MASAPTLPNPSTAGPAIPMPGNTAGIVDPGIVDPLANLRDIHLPGPISELPVAPGWWLLGLLLLIAVFFALRAAVRFWRSNRYRRSGVKQLNQLWLQFQADEDPKHYLLGYAELLKRIALTRYPRERVAALSGEEWVAFLDSTCPGHDFTIGPGQILVDGCYQDEPEFDAAMLHRIGIRWIKSHKARLPS